MRAALLLAALALAGCGRYADFTLPPLPGGAGDFQITFTPRPGPVFPRAQWRDRLNPSVDGGTMLYSAYDGQRWITGRATSPDGFAWTDHGAVLQPEAHTWEGSYIAANGSLLGDLYWYEAGPREKLKIGLARRTG